MYGDHGEFAPVEMADSDRRTSPFPAEWGPPPREIEKRAGWAAAKIHRAALERRRLSPRELLEDLHQRPVGMDPYEALAALRARYVDPSMVRPTLTPEAAMGQLQRKAVRFTTMLRLAGESW